MLKPLEDGGHEGSVEPLDESEGGSSVGAVAVRGRVRPGYCDSQYQLRTMIPGTDDEDLGRAHRIEADHQRQIYPVVL